MAFTVTDPARPGADVIAGSTGNIGTRVSSTTSAGTISTAATTSGNIGLGSAYTPAGASKPFESYAGLVDLPSIRTKTKWNPPLPKVLDNPQRRARNTPRGWLAADPMLITGYELATPGSQPSSDVPTQSGGKDTFGFDQRIYGFRFLFNPTHSSEAYTNTNQIDPLSYMRSMQLQNAPILPQQSGSSMAVELFLSRVDDMRILRRSNWADYYPEAISEEDRTQILKRGTMHDLEFLFRLTNGKRFPTWWSDIETADWGVFFPRPVIVSIGDGPNSIRIRATISSLNITHSVFAPGMIPTVTTISLSLERLVDQMTQGVAWDSDSVDTNAAQPSPTRAIPPGVTTRDVPFGPGIVNGVSVVEYGTRYQPPDRRSVVSRVFGDSGLARVFNDSAIGSLFK